MNRRARLILCKGEERLDTVCITPPSAEITAVGRLVRDIEFSSQEPIEEIAKGFAERYCGQLLPLFDDLLSGGEYADIVVPRSKRRATKRGFDDYFGKYQRQVYDTD